RARDPDLSAQSRADRAQHREPGEGVDRRMNKRSLCLAALLAASTLTAAAQDLADPTRPPGAVPAERKAWAQSSMRVDVLPADREGHIRYNIEAVDASVRAFFEALARNVPENIMVRPDVSGRISIAIRNVTLEDALESLRDLYGYDYRHTNRGYVIGAATLQSRVFHLDYLDLARRGVSTTRVSSGQITQSGNNSSYSGGGGSSEPVVVGGDNSGSGGSSTTTMTGTAVRSQHDSDLWTALAADLHVITGDQPGRSVVINRQSGVIMVRAMPAELRDVADYLDRTAASVQRQVILEAKIVEVELSDAYQAGINWTAVLTSGNKTYTLGQHSPPGGFDVDPLTPSGTPVPIAPGNPVTGFVNSTLGGALTIAADFTDFNAFIELLGVQGRTRVLSSPRVSTLHNQKAVIKAGSDEFF